MKKVEEHIKLSNELLRFLKDDLTLEEESKLKQLLAEDKNLDEWWKQFNQNDYIYNRLSEYAQINLKAKWAVHLAKRKPQIQRKRISSWLMAAASLIVIVVASWWVYQTMNQAKPNITTLTSIHPGSSKAELIVENGKHYILPELEPGIIKEQGTEILHNGKALTYDINNALKPNAKLEAPMHTIIIPRGGEHQLTLADGTKVWLNAQSKLRYPAWFDGDTRQVELSGEAYFTVSHDTTKPFYVNTNSIKLKVLGTEFNIKAYADEKDIAATLIKGKVNIQLKQGTKNVSLKPGEQARTNANNLTVNKVDPYYYTAWKDGVFIFKEEKIQAIFQRLSRWYDFDVFFYNETIKNYSFTGTIKRTEEIMDVLMLLERTNHIKFKIEGKTILVSEL